MLCFVLCLFAIGLPEICSAAEGADGYGPPLSVSRELPKAPVAIKRSLVDQTWDDVRPKSIGCLECHKGIDTHTMHLSPNVVLGCTDCHGGNATPGLTMRKAHVEPRNKLFWESSANPSDSGVLLNHESAEFIQFVNPGDLRVAQQACGTCHASEVSRTGHSMMRHGAMLWGAALYNNGAFPLKNYRYGQAYGPNGETLRLLNPYVPTPEETRTNGVLPFLDPLPRFVLGAAEQYPAHLRKRRREAASTRRAHHDGAAGKTVAAIERTRAGHVESIDPGVPEFAEDAPARSVARLHGEQQSSGRLSLQRLHGLPRGLCE